MKKTLINIMAVMGILLMIGATGAADFADYTYNCESYPLELMGMHICLSFILIAPKLLELEAESE